MNVSLFPVSCQGLQPDLTLSSVFLSLQNSSDPPQRGFDIHHLPECHRCEPAARPLDRPAHLPLRCHGNCIRSRTTPAAALRTAEKDSGCFLFLWTFFEPQRIVGVWILFGFLDLQPRHGGCNLRKRGADGRFVGGEAGCVLAGGDLLPCSRNNLHNKLFL